ncbi:EthD domain-containing protein [Roseomonas gilardii]|uniref:EthD domain-containing protein n=1 Tax=Roseomonas gilardii TaxID=257708 RepID=UPI0016439325|nr:EthD domain-containing protein [Roseomonas gilardii]
MFRSIPEAREHVRRYIQTHPIVERTDAVAVNEYDRTVEIWFDNLQGLDAVLGSPTYREKVFPDEKTFLEHEHTLIPIGWKTEIIG